ncbi:MAG: DUF4105 domain-containing protein, partial [Armatimonadetes bacterium]|nr:DUF4105 domain-containing protein [Armatimonadota bacterium]
VMATAGAERAGLGALAGSVAATLVGHEASRRVDRAFSSRDAVGAAGRRAPTRVPAGLQAARAQSAPAADLEPEPSAPAADPEPEPSAPAADLEPEPSAPAADLEPEPSAAPWQAHQRPTRLLKRGADGSYRLGDVRWGLRTDESGRGYLGDFRDTTVDPRRVQDVFFVLEPFPPERVASHALLYFSFSEPGAVRTRGRDDAEGLVVSVEVRLREGEKFDMQRGLHGGFPVIYQVGTWRDTVEKACLVKQHRLMRYRLALTGPEKEAMLRNALEEAVRARDDERYHTFVNNCNLGALRLINAGLPPARRVPERLLAIPLESPMAFVPTLLPDHLDAHGLIDGPRTVTLPQSTTASESTEGSHYGWPFRFLGGASGALGGGLAARAWHLSPPLGLALTVAAGLTGRRLGQAAQRAGTYGEEPAARWMDRPMVESATEVPRDTPGSVVVP